MPYFRELPFSRIPPYESEPYDLAPVPRPDPYALDQAAAQSYPQSFGTLMPQLDLRYLHRVQSPSASPPQSGIRDLFIEFLRNYSMPNRAAPATRQKTPEGVRATLNRSFRDNGIGFQFGIPF